MANERGTSEDRGPDSGPDPTEAVLYDPFVDDDDDADDDDADDDDADDDDAGDDGGFSQEEPDTEAVAFDPFAEDDDEAVDEDDEDSGISDAAYAELGDMAGLLKDLEKLRRGGGREETSQRSRLQALDTFRERRGTRRASRMVADGMVELPWVQPAEPKEAVSYTHLTLPTIYSV